MTRSIKNLIAAMLIAISGYLAWTQIWPSYPVITFLKERIEEKNNLLASKAEVIQKIDKLRQESKAKYVELQRLALVVPEKKGLSEIITAVENIYSRNGFILPELALGDSPGAEQLGYIGLKTSVGGTYNQILTFLSYFEKNIRLFDVNKIEIGLSQASKNEIVKDTDPKLGLTIDGQFYWLQQLINSGSTGGGQPVPVRE